MLLHLLHLLKKQKKLWLNNYLKKSAGFLADFYILSRHSLNYDIRGVFFYSEYTKLFAKINKKEYNTVSPCFETKVICFQ